VRRQEHGHVALVHHYDDLGIGIPQSNGAGCLLTQTVAASAAAAPQITVAVDAGTYCVRLYDTGSLVTQVAFIVTIVRP